MDMPEAFESHQAAPMAAAAPPALSRSRAGVAKASAGGAPAGGDEPWRKAPDVQAPSVPDSQMLVKNGNVQLEVSRSFQGGVRAALQQVAAATAKAGGTVQSQNMNSEDVMSFRRRQRRSAAEDGRLVLSGSMTLRVPVAAFDDFFAGLADLPHAVLHASSNVQDVTSQYVDTVARVNTQRASLKQLEGIMAAASKVSDLTAVQASMMRVVEALERQEAAKARLEQAAAMSTVHVNFQLEAAEPRPAEPKPLPAWSASSSFRRAVAALMQTVQGLADVVITAVVVGVPLACVAAAVLWGSMHILAKVASLAAGDIGSAVGAVRAAAQEVSAATAGSGASSGASGGGGSVRHRGSAD